MNPVCPVCSHDLGLGRGVIWVGDGWYALAAHLSNHHPACASADQVAGGWRCACGFWSGDSTQSITCHLKAAAAEPGGLREHFLLHVLAGRL